MEDLGFAASNHIPTCQLWVWNIEGSSLTKSCWPLQMEAWNAIVFQVRKILTWTGRRLTYPVWLLIQLLWLMRQLMTFIMPQTNNPGWKMSQMQYDLLQVSPNLQTNICFVIFDLCASDKLGISEAEQKTVWRQLRGQVLCILSEREKGRWDIVRSFVGLCMSERLSSNHKTISTPVTWSKTSNSVCLCWGNAWVC